MFLADGVLITSESVKNGFVNLSHKARSIPPGLVHSAQCAIARFGTDVT